VRGLCSQMAQPKCGVGGSATALVVRAPRDESPHRPWDHRLGRDRGLSILDEQSACSDAQFFTPSVPPAARGTARAKGSPKFGFGGLRVRHKRRFCCRVVSCPPSRHLYVTIWGVPGAPQAASPLGLIRTTPLAPRTARVHGEDCVHGGDRRWPERRRPAPDDHLRQEAAAFPLPYMEGWCGRAQTGSACNLRQRGVRVAHPGMGPTLRVALSAGCRSRWVMKGGVRAGVRSS